jgi:hypothetical protein
LIDGAVQTRHARIMVCVQDCVRGLGVLLCAGACGPVAGQPDADGDGTVEESGQGTESSGDPGDATSGADDDVADATTVAADDTTTGEPVGLLCGATDPSQALAVLSFETGAAVLRGDGSVMPLALPDPMAPPDVDVYPSITARGDWIAVVWAWSVLGEGVTYGSHLAVLTAAGELSWEHEEPNASMSSAQIGYDGSIVVQRTPTGGEGEGVVLFGPDDEIVLPEFYPSGPLGTDGWIRGYRTTPEGISMPGWMSTELQWQGVRATTLPSWHARADGAFVYVTPGDATPALVIDTPAEATTMPLPMLAGIDEQALYVQSSPEREWLLVHETEGRWWRIAVADGTTEELALELPDGATTLECYQPAAVIDDAGRVSMSTRDASSAALLRFEPATAEWTPMGERVTNVDDMGALVFGETLLVHTSAAGQTFCPPQTYEPGRTELAGATQQLVRPIDGIARVLPAESWASPDPTGVCAGLVTAEGVTVLDLVQEQEIDIADAHLVTWWSR